MFCPICNNPNIKVIGINPTFPNSNIYECEICQFGFTYPVPTSGELSNFYQIGFYDKSSIEEFEAELNEDFSKTLDNYIINHRSLLEHRPLSQFKFIYPFLPDTEEKKALEIGCSSGSLLALLGENGFSVTGYEPDRKMSLLASKRLEGEGNAIFNHMIDSEGWKKNHFDLICSSHVLEHISHPIEHLNLVKKSLKKNGLLFMEVPNEYSLGIEKVINKVTNPVSAEHGHLYYYSPRSLEIFLDHCGFNVLSMKTCGHNVKNHFSSQPEKYLIQSQGYNPLSIISKLMKKGYRVFKSFFNSAPYSPPQLWAESWFDHYYENDDGVWIRVVASPKN
ncbi:class I SAM-dependent methyltransferase [Anabaena sp. CCY 0017]|uniref:class I SAM-dependent methyltransferase n=1 Tax=Anabaena sp. CCY 0017 TaxID=3103866 RepID=UPI0039C60E43